MSEKGRGKYIASFVVAVVLMVALMGYGFSSFGIGGSGEGVIAFAIIGIFIILAGYATLIKKG